MKRKARMRKSRVNPEAIAAWKRGDVWGVHDALGLAPWEYSPVPLRFGAYGLPDERPERQSTMMEQSWDGAKELQDELLELAGPVGSEAPPPEYQKQHDRMFAPADGFGCNK